MTHNASSPFDTASFSPWWPGGDSRADELNQQIEVREVTTICAAAGQGTGSFESSANAGEGAGAIPQGTLRHLHVSGAASEHEPEVI